MKTENVVNEPEESVDDAEVENSLSWKFECFVHLGQRHGSYHIPGAKSRFSRSKDTLDSQMQGKRPVRVDQLALANIRRRHLEALQAICTQRYDMHASAP